jgi:hypothetical protein
MTAQDRPYQTADIEEPEDRSGFVRVSLNPCDGCSSGMDGMRVTDDWPRPMPVVPREIVIIETYLASLLGELLGSKNRRG